MPSHTPTDRCQNCDWTTEDTADLCQIGDIFQRVQPGDVMPDGECPECGGVCFEDEAKPTLQERHDALLAALEAAYQIILEIQGGVTLRREINTEMLAPISAAIQKVRGV